MDEDDAERELERARGALNDARVLLEGEGTDDGVVKRLYFAMFHAAQASLYDLGNNPSSHGQVRQQFGQEMVLAGHATREEGRLLGKLYDYRREADYGTGRPSVDMAALLDDIDAFVEKMEQFVRNEL